MEVPETTEFVTGDILMSSFLVVRGFYLKRLKPETAGRFSFVFENSPELARAAIEFLQDGLVPVRSLARTLSQLRNRCRNNREDEQTGPGNAQRR